MTTVLTLLSDAATPVALFNEFSRTSDTAFLFESTEGDVRLARYSILGADPSLLVTFDGDTATVRDRLRGTERRESAPNPLAFLRDLLAAHRNLVNARLELPFTGGFVGYLGYAATNRFENIQRQERKPYDTPDGAYGLYDSFILFDHLYRKIHIVSHRGKETAEAIRERIENRQPLPPLRDNASEFPDSDVFNGVSDTFDKDGFCALVEQCKEYIGEGQVFQIVPSHRFSLPVSAHPNDIYRTLVSLNPSPYAYHLKFPGFDYIGSSPETFVTCQNGKVTLRALAGTRPRGVTPADDEQLATELRADEKELAEHRMLVDLGRNDLGRVCKVGTVKTGEIAQVVRYTHVMHLATEVTGDLRDDKTAFDVIQGCFPRGTVSGAPKIRAMELLSKLEPEQRGIYSGTVGYIDFNGNTDGAIAIRSTLVQNGVAHVNAGAGVVFDSVPELEYEETRNKAKSVLKAIQIAERQVRRAAAH